MIVGDIDYSMRDRKNAQLAYDHKHATRPPRREDYRNPVNYVYAFNVRRAAIDRAMGINPTPATL